MKRKNTSNKNPNKNDILIAKTVRNDVNAFLKDGTKLDYQNEYPFPANRFTVCIGIQKYNEGKFITSGVSIKLHSINKKVIAFQNLQIYNEKEFMFLMERSNVLSKMINPDLLHG